MDIAKEDQQERDNPTVSVPEDSNQVEEDVGEVVKHEVFKKPLLLIGPRKGKTAGKIKAVENCTLDKISDQPEDNDDSTTSDKLTECISLKTEDLDVQQIQEQKFSSKLSPAQKLKDSEVPLPYKEPKWGGVPTEQYSLEVLKCGRILETIDLSSKPFFVFGRLSTCDVHMAHPMVSRFHAVLQYRSEGTEDKPVGFYIYDLGSTHGTFLNKYRIKPYMYVKVHVGHMLKLGGSTRMFIMQGPEKDMEQESELTVTELKEKHQQELQEKVQQLAREVQEEQLKQEEEEKNGIDWGMGEDAEEETDLSENPFAATPNEELYITDPKKTLRGWFEREGYDLEYDVEEKGFGQFLCRVELPVESTQSGTMVAEALVKGKKKEAVVQCALEACRILDRHGLLRQATHESKKRKAKNWEEQDFYDSDEDTFLDRTGAVEKKRQQRMQAAGKVITKTETYESLMKKHQDVLHELQEVQAQLHAASANTNSSHHKNDSEEVDALDAFMSNLSSEVPDKKLIGKLKSQLTSLKQEETRLRKLVNIAKPASLPELIPHQETMTFAAKQTIGTKGLPMIGARCRPKMRKPQGENMICEEPKSTEVNAMEEEEEEEEDCDEASVNPSSDVIKESDGTFATVSDKVESQEETSGSSSVDLSVRKFSQVIGPSLPPPGILNEEATEKQRKKNKRRIEEKNEKAVADKKTLSIYDSNDPDYSMWVPPEGQSGDGRTKLNEKYGY